VQYKLHIAFASRPDMVDDAVESVDAIGNIHLWPNGDNWQYLRTRCVGLADVHRLPPMAPVSIINLLLHKSWDDDVMFWMHNDAYAKPGVAKRLLQHVTDLHNSDKKWGAVFTHYDVLCALNMKAVREIGFWDPMFFQYTADVEYYGRMRAAGWEIDESTFGKDDVEHRQGSITVQSDPSFNYRTQWRERTNFDKNYHVLKWGSWPGQPFKYSTPFNGKTEKFQ